MRTGRRIEAVDVAGQDVHPAQYAPVRVPDRPFGQLTLGGHCDVSGDHPGHAR